MYSRSCLCLLYFGVCLSVTMASDNLPEIQIQHMGGNVLRISCDITITQNSAFVSLLIFKDTPNNTLVILSNGDCPIVVASARAKHIYLPHCESGIKKSRSLDFFLQHYNGGDNPEFGCTYTYVTKIDDIQHSLSSIRKADNTSTGEVNQTNSTCALKECLDVQKDLLIALITTTTILLLVIIFLIIAVAYGRKVMSFCHRYIRRVRRGTKRTTTTTTTMDNNKANKAECNENHNQSNTTFEMVPLKLNTAKELLEVKQGS